VSLIIYSVLAQQWKLWASYVLQSMGIHIVVNMCHISLGLGCYTLPHYPCSYLCSCVYRWCSFTTWCCSSEWKMSLLHSTCSWQHFGLCISQCWWRMYNLPLWIVDSL